jgi:hypothetical protein
MTNPGKNRLTGYEAGWMTFLVKARLATRAEAQAAFDRVAQAAIDRLNRRKRKKRRPE